MRAGSGSSYKTSFEDLSYASVRMIEVICYKKIAKK